MIRVNRGKEIKPAAGVPSRAHRFADVIQRDDGLYQIGFDDSAPGPFESRRFAEAVALAASVASS